MHCTNCGTLLPQGAANCPVCGTPAGIASAPQNPQGYDPTVVAQPYGTPQSTGYGTPSYGVPPQSGTPSNPYQPPTQDVYGNYGQPAQPNNFGQPAQPGYGYPSQPSQPAQPNYGYPQQDQPAQQANYGYPQGSYVPPVVPGAYGVAPVAPKKRSRVGLIIGIVLGVILLICIGVGALIAVAVNSAGKTISSTATKVASSTNAPSGKTIVPAAAAILSNPQTSTSVDNNYNPTHVTSTFTTSDTVYVTFDINSGTQDGFIEAKWYADGQLLSDKSFAHTHTNNVGLFSKMYTTATTSGITELYWCKQSDCSDAQLAQVVHFTVTSSAFVPRGVNVALLQDADRRLF